jgi:hypothetical protein
MSSNFHGDFHGFTDGPGTLAGAWGSASRAGRFAVDLAIAVGMAGC